MRLLELAQAKERGDTVEVKQYGAWSTWSGIAWHSDLTYRIKPKKELGLVERLRQGLKSHCLLDMDDVKLAADHIEELEEILNKNIDRIDNDMLVTLLKRRLK